jgi:BirA family transcriptional regulator, biotin operon repressor / biotin---[acetyl-CoA-carboxylase] ligase
MDADAFDLVRIAADSGVAALEFQAEVVSTNDWALSLAGDSARSWPLLVLAAEQTGGRGRGTNRWWSSAGALTFSLVVDAAAWQLPLDRWPQIALATGLAICESLQAVFPPGVFALKWPNDVYLAGRKVCGILVEAPSHRGRVVIGVGLNVNNSLAGAPPEVKDRSAALCDAAGAEFDLTEVLIAVVGQMNQRLAGLAGEVSLAADFSRYCLLTGRTVKLETGRHEILGSCRGIDDQGALMVQTPSGLERIRSGTVVSWQ